ncbi:speckle-type POZ protein-like [Leptopilina heterotoma]|uniref:speckle-type POZ protein-like n=1 Tax=Leptopilina heterotoma TaxID=63436 RepID=UPI001CA7EABF|nr:speckle-type POZ protein-like [Leptopilina heterotoma]
MNCKKRRLDDVDHIESNLVTSNCECKWTICNFKELLGTTLEIKSNELSSKKNEFSGWFATLKIHNEEDEEQFSSSTESYISFHINCNDNDKSFLKLNFELSILNENDEKCNVTSLKNLSPINLKTFGFTKFITWDKLFNPNDKLLRDDAVEFFIKITLTEYEIKGKNSKANEKETTVELIENKYPNLMFQNADFSDLTIVFDDVNLLVHKVILAGKSEVLYKKIKNLKDSELRLPIPLSIGQELIAFIYTGQCPNLMQYIDELYDCSLRLKIDDLKMLIVTTLKYSIQIENALNRLIWAEKRHCTDLKIHAINFIKSEIPKIIATPEFQNLIENYPNLTRELFFATVENYEGQS